MYYSACMEVSEHSSEGDRVHLHLYLSWHKAGAHGIDHQTTNEWVFNGVRPRVDSNTEARSPWQWLRATHHGHWSSVGLFEAEVFRILKRHRRCKSWALIRGDAYIHFMLHFLTPSLPLICQEKDMRRNRPPGTLSQESAAMYLRATIFRLEFSESSARSPQPGN